MGKLSIVTDSNLDSEKLKIDVADKKIYYGDSLGATVLIEGNLKYRPLHCSELSNKLSDRNWNKSETLFISNEDDPTLMYRKYTSETYKSIGEIDEIDTENIDPNLSFPLCKPLDFEVRNKITEMYEDKFDSEEPQDSHFLVSLKNPMNTSECLESIDIIKGYDSYTSSLSLCELIEYSSNPGISARVDLSIRYSKIDSSGIHATVYNYFTMFKAFEYSRDGNLNVENTVEIINDESNDLIRIEYLGGIIRLFPISDTISECIINDCTIVYGKFR